MHLESKPRHVTPQINHLRKLSPVLSVSTHIYGVSMKIDRWENVHVQLSSLCNRSSVQKCPLYSIPYFSEILRCMFSKHVLAEKVVFSCSYSSKNL